MLSGCSRPRLSNGMNAVPLPSNAMSANGHHSSSAAMQVEALASKTAFGSPLVTNHFRGLVAEAIVSLALVPDWRWCSADYWAWDFDRADGLRLEVKQSAARQTWTSERSKPSKCRFDIRARKGRLEGADWLDEPGRSAHIYVLAHHFVADLRADHRDPGQWRFYVVPTLSLPASDSIGLGPVTKLTHSCSHAELPTVIERVAGSCLSLL